MWNCCSSRDPKKNRFLTTNLNNEWIQAHQELPDLNDNDIQVEVQHVSLNSYDKQSILAHQGIGHSFSGKVKNSAKTSLTRRNSALEKTIQSLASSKMTLLAH